MPKNSGRRAYPPPGWLPGASADSPIRWRGSAGQWEACSRRTHQAFPVTVRTFVAGQTAPARGWRTPGPSAAAIKQAHLREPNRGKSVPAAGLNVSKLKPKVGPPVHLKRAAPADHFQLPCRKQKRWSTPRLRYGTDQSFRTEAAHFGFLRSPAISGGIAQALAPIDRRPRAGALTST